MENLTKAMLVASEAGVNMEVCFNPKEFSVEKQVQWTPKEGSIDDEPPEEFTKPTPATMSVTLHFDTYEKKTPVTSYTDKLEKLAHIVDKSLKRPPLCIFVWGNFKFQGVVESLGLKFTMFLANGTPVRCEATLKMKKARQAVTGSGGK
jgi:hypothetical protein